MYLLSQKHDTSSNYVYILVEVCVSCWFCVLLVCFATTRREQDKRENTCHPLGCTLHAGSAIDLRPIQTHTRPPRINIARIGSAQVSRSFGRFPIPSSCSPSSMPTPDSRSDEGMTS